MGGSLSLPLSCTDPAGRPLTLQIADQPTHGTLRPIQGSTVTYTPSIGYTGVDRFSYTGTNDYGLRDTATITLTVKPVTQSSCRPPICLK